MLQAGVIYQQRSSLQSQTARSNGTSSFAVKDAAKGTILDLTGLPIQGAEHAKVVLVEFSDYECPFCARHANSVEPEITKEYVLTGKLRYAFANNPLRIHLQARPIAAAAICAGEQRNFWTIHQVLFSSLPKSDGELRIALDQSNVDFPKMDVCRQSQRPSERIEKDVLMAKSLGLTSTPSFALGTLNSEGKLDVQKVISGAHPMSVFQQAINQTLTQSR
jgi:protein-disulfide isomerase